MSFFKKKKKNRRLIDMTGNEQITYDYELRRVNKYNYDYIARGFEPYHPLYTHEFDINVKMTDPDTKKVVFTDTLSNYFDGIEDFEHEISGFDSISDYIDFYISGVYQLAYNKEKVAHDKEERMNGYKCKGDKNTPSMTFKDMID